MHFYFNNAITFTGIATTAFDVERKTSCFIATLACSRYATKELSDGRE
jgi:hypothetical protein